MTVTAVAIASLITKLGLVRDDVTFQLIATRRKSLRWQKRLLRSFNESVSRRNGSKWKTVNVEKD